MSTAPKVTVVIPTYNAENYLAAAVDSVLRQTFSDYELLILDNASTDGTPTLMGRYTDSRVAYRRNSENLGLAGNVARGIREARGHYIIFLGADDIWEPQFLAKAVAFLEAAPQISMVHGPAAWIDEEGRRFGGTGNAWPQLTPGPRAMLEAFAAGFCFSTMVMRTALVRATGPIGEEWQEVIDLWLFLRMCLAGDVGYLDEVLCEYRVHGQAMSMPMYRQNLMFRRQMTAAREAFAWPEAAALGVAHHRRAAERHAARIAVDVLHMSRVDGRIQFAKNLAEIVRAVPEILLRPATWVRISFGLLPSTVIRDLKHLRHQRAVSRGAPAGGMKRDAVDALVLMAGRISFVALWFLALLLVYRSLGAEADGLAQAGLFALAIACVKVVSGCLSDPVDLAVMRGVPTLLRTGDPRAFEMLRAAFGLRLGAVAVIAIALTLGAPLIAKTFLARPDAVSLVRIVAAAMVGDIAFRSVLVVLQVSERFRSLVLLEAFLQIGRFITILLLWANDLMRVELILACYAAVPFTVTLAGLTMLPKELFRSISFHRHDLLDLFHYLKWMIPAMMLAALNERLDIFFIYSFTGAEAAGLYGALLTLALIPDLVAACLSTILQPRIVALKASGQFAETMRRFLTFSVPICGLGFLVSLAVAEPIIEAILGARYVPAIPAFEWLLAGTLFWLAITPLPMTLVAVLAPRRIALVTAGQTIIVLVGGLTLVPWLGAIGMAQTVFVMRVIIALVLVAAARNMTVAAPTGSTPLTGSVQP